MNFAILSHMHWYISPYRSIFILGLLLSTTDSISEQPTVQQAEFATVHWAYSAFLGSGWYDSGDNRSIFVLRIPPSWTFGDSSISDSGIRMYGIKLRFPLTVGVHSIDGLPGLIEADNFASASFTPGVELEVPVNELWHLRPYVNVGWGKEFERDSSAWIYYGGVKSQYVIPRSYGDWSLIGSLAYSGYNPDIGESDSLGSVLLGTEFRQPLKKTRLAGEPIDLHWHFSYTYLTEDLKFELPGDAYQPLRDRFTVGLGFGLRNKKFKLWFLEFDRLGMDYAFDSDGDFRSITFHASSWFNR